MRLFHDRHLLQNALGTSTNGEQSLHKVKYVERGQPFKALAERQIELHTLI